MILQIAVNNQHFTEFTHRILPMNALDTLEVNGDLRLTMVRFQWRMVPLQWRMVWLYWTVYSLPILMALDYAPKFNCHTCDHKVFVNPMRMNMNIQTFKRTSNCVLMYKKKKGQLWLVVIIMVNVGEILWSEKFIWVLRCCFLHITIVTICTVLVQSTSCFYTGTF